MDVGQILAGAYQENRKLAEMHVALVAGMRVVKLSGSVSSKHMRSAAFDLIPKTDTGYVNDATMSLTVPTTTASEHTCSG